MKSSAELQPILEQARRRLYPSIRDPNYLVLSKRRKIFERWIQQINGHGLTILDIGGRVPTYRKLLEGRIAHYVSLDILATPSVDVLARGEQLPLPAGIADLVICTQVLQYIPRPELVFSEILRVLKPGGIVMLSAPAAQARDAGAEYWRFSPASLRMLLAPFAHVEVVPEGSSISGFFRTVNVYMSIFAKFRALRAALSFTLYPACNIAAICLEAVARSRNDQFTVNYSAMARKPQKT